jgi:tetratricopeptide (TPR) repeat protein
MFKKYLPSFYDGIVRALPQRRRRQVAPPDAASDRPAPQTAERPAEDAAVEPEQVVPLPDSPDEAERNGAHRQTGQFRHQSAAAYQKLAEALKRHGMLEEAAAYYRKAIELNASQPDRPQPAALLYQQQAAAYCSEAQWEAAIVACEQAVQLEPTAVAYKTWGDALLALGQLEAAMQRYGQAIELQPDWAEVHANLGSLYAQQQQWQSAIDCYQKAVVLKPDFAGAYRNLARVWTQLHETESAIACWYQALKLEPERFSAAEHVNFGNLLLNQEQIEQAIGCYHQAIDRDPTLTGVYQNLAEALSRQEQWEAAVSYYRQAMALAAQAPPARSTAPPQPVTPFDIAADQLQHAQTAYAQAEWETTIAACEQAMAQLEPQTIAAYKTWGSALYALGRFAEATRCYVRVTELQPNVAEAHANLGSLYAQQQQWQSAIDCYQKALALKPDFAGAYRNLARVWQQTGDSAAAAACWYQALVLEPQATAADFAKLGQALSEQGKVAAAIDCYRRALQQDPRLIAVYRQLTAIFEQEERLEEAIVCYRQAIEQFPETAEFHDKLGQALRQSGDWKQAIDCYRTVVRLEPSATAYRNLGELLVQQEAWEQAVSCYQQLVELEPEEWQHHHTLGDALNHRHQWKQAVAAYRRAIALNPDFSWCYNNLGDALLQLDRWQEAAVALRQAIVLNPDFHWSHYNLGEALANLSDWNGAIAAYCKALNLQPDLPYAHQKLGNALQQRAKLDLTAALKCYYHAIRQQPDEVQNYHKALELKPDDSELLVGLGTALAKQNQLDGAIVFYQMALQIHPNESEASLQLARVLERKNRLDHRHTQLHFNHWDDAYAYWRQQNSPNADDLRRMADAVRSLSYQPLISVIMPVYNVSKSFLNEAIRSVLNQIYPHWELCIADDASTQPHIKPLLEEYAKDARIKLVFRQENGHISACSNSALSLATGEFVILLDHDDVLAPEALFEVVCLLNQHPEADMIYSDEDKLNILGEHTAPFFKPDWCPESFLSRMYTCHLGTYRRSLINKIGGFRTGYEGAQDWDLVLRLTEQTEKIFHIPKVLYHWRSHPGSTAGSATVKSYAYEAAEKALADALQRRGETGRVVSSYKFPGWYTIRYAITDYQLVSIIIPTRNLGSVLDRCLQSIFEKSTYPNYEVIVLDNGSDEPETAAVLNVWKQREPNRFRCCELDIPFNYSRINNYAANQANGEYLLFLNNDTEVITPDWIEAMVEQAQRPAIGAVGALLLYPDRSIQHAGVVLGIGDVAGHSHKRFAADDPGYFGQTVTVNNYSAVTGACMMCRRSTFAAAGGFDEQLAVAYNDVDFCLKLMQQGYRNVYLPHAVLYHYESKSRGYEDTPDKQQRYRQEATIMQQRWQEAIEHDRCYSRNLTRRREDYRLNINTQVEILEVRLSERDTDRLLGWFIDSPELGRAYDVTSICVRGWVLAQHSPAMTLEVLCNGCLLQTTPIRDRRPDVAAVYAVAGAEHSGYKTEIRLAEIPQEAELDLWAVCQDNSRLGLGQVQLRHTV